MSSLLFCKQLIFYCTKIVDALIWIFLDGSYIDFLICCTIFYLKSTYLVSHILTSLMFFVCKHSGAYLRRCGSQFGKEKEAKPVDGALAQN
jgi:hypothetical protein